MQTLNVRCCILETWDVRLLASCARAFGVAQKRTSRKCGIQNQRRARHRPRATHAGRLTPAKDGATFTTSRTRSRISRRTPGQSGSGTRAFRLSRTSRQSSAGPKTSPVRVAPRPKSPGSSVAGVQRARPAGPANLSTLRRSGAVGADCGCQWQTSPTTACAVQVSTNPAASPV